MMNQAASATRRAPADSSTSTGCCPMLNPPFFGILAPNAAPQCFLSSQAQQLVQLNRQPQQQSNVVLPPQQQTVSQQPATLSGQQQQLQSQPQQLTTQRSRDQTSNNYSTSLTTPNLALQHLLERPYQTTNCVALAAALAQIQQQQHQQQQQQQQQQHQQQQRQQQQQQHQQQQQQQQQLLTQNHQATPINQQIQTVAHSTVVNQVTQSNAAPNHTNQVPLLNYNSYPSAPFTNLPTLSVPQSAPQVAAYLGHQHQTNSIPSILSTNLDTIAQNTLSNSANNLHQNNVQQPRPLVTNTTLNGPLPNSVYRNAQQQTTEQQAPNVHQQQPSTPTPAQQLGQATRSISSDDTLNSMINDQFQATMILNQLLATHQFSLPLVAPQLQSQQIAAPQQLVDTSRTQTTLPLSGQSPIVMTPAQQQATPTQIVPPQHQHQPSLEQASENQLQHQQQTFNHSTIQPRVNQAPQPPTSSTNETYLSSVNNAASGSYRSHPNNDPHNQRPPSNPVLQAHQGPQTLSQPPPPPQPQSHHHQPHTGLPHMPFYAYPQDGTFADQAMRLLQDPRVAQSLFGHLFTLIRDHGYRQEPQHTNHHHATHHFHHLHGAHHHHHGQNGQTNGQDASMPLDSLAINESKPRGLSRAEIDSLTPYIHTNEKDARTCVICLSKFELKSKIRPLPCNHAFHAKCVDKWLRTNRTCPICRRDALKTFNGKIKRI